MVSLIFGGVTGLEVREQGGIRHNTTFKRGAVKSLGLVLGNKSCLELRR